MKWYIWGLIVLGLALIIAGLSSCSVAPHRVIVSPAIADREGVWVVPKGAYVGNYKTPTSGVYLNAEATKNLYFRLLELEVLRKKFEPVAGI